MFGNHFYHQSIRKAVAVFGSLFDNLRVVRKSNTGAVISQVKVPLSYAPKRDFLDRIENMKDGEEGERQVAVKLPRMSFEIVSMNYDNGRQLPKLNQCKSYNKPYDGTAKNLYSPVPYNVQFQLSIYAKSQDDALQVVEQILPYFTPDYTVSINPLDGLDNITDTPITFTGISFTDDYENLLEARRTIIYTLDFEMKMNLFKSLSNKPKGVITSYDVDLLNMDGTELFTTVSGRANQVAGNTGIVNEQDEIRNSNFVIKNTKANPQGLRIKSQPENGRANIQLDKTITTRDGTVVVEGTWSYQSDNDYYGFDPFVVELYYSGGLAFDFTVTPEVVNVTDAITDEITGETEQLLIIDVGANDTFSGSGQYVIASGGEPLNGVVAVTDDASGVFNYTSKPGFTGTDSFYYRFIPDKGKSEVGLVNITIVAA